MASLATSNPASTDETKKAPLTAEEKKARREARRKARRAARTMPDSIKNNTFFERCHSKITTISTIILKLKKHYGELKRSNLKR